MSAPVAEVGGPMSPDPDRNPGLDPDPLDAPGTLVRRLFGLLEEPDVSDVLVNGPGEVWCERNGVLQRTGVWLRRRDIDLMIEQLLVASGRRVDRASPIVDARLAEGSRLNVVLPPIAVDGPCVSIRRFTVQGRDLADFADSDTCAQLIQAVTRRLNIVVSGPTGSGKTSLLNALAAFMDPTERIVTIEDAAELALEGGHIIRLQTRAPSTEGTGRVTTADLVRTALRLRPDRILVGECRGGEAHDMIQAMHTGHRGSMTTVHANSTADALERLAVLAASAGNGVGIEVLRAQLASAVDLVVHLSRGENGNRRIGDLEEIG